MMERLARLRRSTLAAGLTSCVVSGQVRAPAVARPEPGEQKQAPPKSQLVVNRPLTIAFVATGGFLWLASDRLWHDELSPTSCRIICEPNGVNPFDRILGNALRWDDDVLPQYISEVSSYFAVPLLAVGGLTLSSVVLERRRENWLDDMLVVAEATVATGLVNRAVALTFGRTRPRIRNLPPGEPVPPDDRQAYQSFFSGHVSEAFSLGLSAATVASIRHYRSARWIWVGTILLGTLDGYMRLAGDDHYVTDVLAGAVVGTAFGIGMPLLHRSKRGPQLAVAPLHDGASLALTGGW